MDPADAKLFLNSPSGTGTVTGPPGTATGTNGVSPIDTNRPRIQNPDGSVSTERTITVEADGKHYLIPTIVSGKELSMDDAVAAWRSGTNKEVGVFNSEQEANNYAKVRSQQIGEMLAPATTSALKLSDPMGLGNIPLPTDPAYAAAVGNRGPSGPSEQTRFLSETEKLTGGVPLDTSQGVTKWERFLLSFRREKENQIQFLQKEYGADSVKLDARGDPIVKVLDEDTGKEKFIPIDEDKMSAKDFIDLAGAVPELAAGILSLRAGRSTPKVGTLTGIRGSIRDLLTTAAGAEAAGGVKDVVANLVDTGKPDLLNVAGDRAAMGVGDVVVGGGLNLFTKVVGKVFTPFGDKPGPIQFDAAAARDYFKNTYGIDIPMTAGELTGSTFLLRSEAMLKKLPGGSGDFATIRKQQEEAFRQIQNIALGISKEADAARRAAIPSDEIVGQGAVQALESKVAPVTAGVASSRLAAVDATNKALLAEVNALTPGAPQLYKSKVGEAIRAKVTAIRDAFEAEASTKYEAAKVLPGGRDRILQPPNMAGDAKALLDKLPAKDVVKTVPTGVLNAQGQPITRTTTGREILREFIPDKVLAKLQSLTDLKGQKFSLEDLIQMRNEVTNDIKAGEAIPGVQTHFLGKIRDLLTKSIDESTGALPTGELKKAWMEANKFYADNVGKFHKPGISGILKNPDVPGHVGDSEIVGRLTSGTEKANDLFRDMRDFLGDKSPEFSMLKRSIADELLAKSSVIGENMIDGKLFLSNLQKMFTNNREIAESVFGQSAGSLSSFSKLLQESQVTGMLDKDTVAGLLKDPKMSGLLSKFSTAITEQDKLTTLYRNKILKAISTKKLDEIGIEPEEFVTRFWDKASHREIEQVIAQLHDRPDVVGNIRQKVVQKIFYDAARNPSSTDPVRLGTDAMRLPSTESLLKALGTETEQQKIQTILGQDTYKTLIEFAKAMRPTESADKVFSAAGGLSAGMQIGQMFRGGDLSYIANFLKYKLGSIIITSPGLKAWAGNRMLSEGDKHAMVSTMVASAPFIQQLITDLGEDGAKVAMEQIKASIDTSIQQGQGAAPDPNAQREAAKAFLNSTNP